MNDEDLLRDLARIAREEAEIERRRLDERWDRLSAGTLDRAEENELRRTAERSELHRRAWDAFRPLGPDVKARLARKARDRLAGGEPGRGEVDGPEEGPPASLHSISGHSISGRWRSVSPRRRMLLAAAAVVLAALGLAQLALWRELPAMPAYLPPEVSAVVDTRSEASPAEGERHVVVPGYRFEVYLRPRRRVEGEIDVRIFMEREDGRLTRWEAAERTSRIFDGGVVRIGGPELADRSVPPGDWTFLVAIGRADALPSLDEMRELRGRGESSGSEHWRLSETALRVREEDDATESDAPAVLE